MNGRDVADAADAEKTTEALLGDARSAQRRVDKLADAALAAADTDAHQLGQDAQHTMGQLVDHLMRAKQQRHREVQAALRRMR